MLITFLGKTKGSKVDLPRKLSEQQNQNNFRICHWLFLYKRKIVFFYNLSKVILNKLICLPLFHFNQNIFRFQQNLFLNYKNDLCIFWLLMIKDNLNELKQFLRSWFQFPVGERVLQIGHKPELTMMETDVMRCFLVAWEGTRLRQKYIMKSNNSWAHAYRNLYSHTYLEYIYGNVRTCELAISYSDVCCTTCSRATTQ